MSESQGKWPDQPLRLPSQLADVMASVRIALLTCSKPQKREYSRQLGIHLGNPGLSARFNAVAFLRSPCLRPLSYVKSLAVPDASRVRRVPFGLFKGIRLDINLRSQTQTVLGLWERETYAAIRQAASRAQWFIDVGAGKGELCIYFANLDRLTRIIAIEPSQTEAEALAANLGCNSIAPNRVELLQKFCGTKGDDDHIQLDQLGISPENAGFIKIDVDGFELDVLRSGRQLLMALLMYSWKHIPLNLKTTASNFWKG